MQIGIIGLLNSGKSTLFDVLTGHFSGFHDRSGSDPRIGNLSLYDDRLEEISDIYSSKKITHPSFILVDLPPMRVLKSSMDSGASKVLEEAKNGQALIQVVRQFTNPSVPEPDAGINAVKEKYILDSELSLIDLSIIENKLEKIESMRHKKPDFFHPREPELLQKCKDTIENEKPLSTLDLTGEDEKLLRGYQFLTLKPRITVINIDESEIGNAEKWASDFDKEFPSQAGTFIAVACRPEQELLELSDEEERAEFAKELGINQSSETLVTNLLIKTMNLIRFLTGGPTEARSWVIPNGICAQEAAGTIHTDIERGFIRAEVIKYEDILEYRSESKCKDQGKYRLEGKQYIVKEGDLIYFRFNV